MVHPVHPARLTNFSPGRVGSADLRLPRSRSAAIGVDRRGSPANQRRVEAASAASPSCFRTVSIADASSPTFRATWNASGIAGVQEVEQPLDVEE